VKTTLSSSESLLDELIIPVSAKVTYILKPLGVYSVIFHVKFNLSAFSFDFVVLLAGTI